MSNKEILTQPAGGGGDSGGQLTSWQKFIELMQRLKVREFLQKYTMIIALFAVIIAFGIMSDWKILSNKEITNLIGENAYVFVLATGMLLCILTGGNIDLSVGSVVCFTGGIGCIMMTAGANMWLAVAVMLISANAVNWLYGLLHWPELLIKIIVDCTLFVFNYVIQKKLIFKK